MTTNDTEAGKPAPTAEPLALRLNDQLGRAPERYVPVMDRGPQDTAHSEMLRLLDLSARQAAELERLRAAYENACAQRAAIGAELAAERERWRAQAARDTVETRWAMREQIAAWLDGQGQPGYATEVRCREWA